jgi:hypothetical protein
MVRASAIFRDFVPETFDFERSEERPILLGLRAKAENTMKSKRLTNRTYHFAARLIRSFIGRVGICRFRYAFLNSVSS